MRVDRLIELLQTCNQEANVLIWDGLDFPEVICIDADSSQVVLYYTEEDCQDCPNGGIK